MSGFLRRIKRSRPADAGEPHPEGQAAPSEGAAPTQSDDPAVTAADAPGASTQRTAWMAPAEPQGEAAAGPEEKPRPAEPGKPVLLANPETPAGLELGAQTAPRPPAGRRGRLRRRLRYLRRARELMLRDLGGLLFEVHRTGGGNVDAHATVLNAKVQRISGLDAEVHALEAALASPRAEDIVFQPGIGGTCPTCGELYSSAAHFCANCGASVKDLPVPTPVATEAAISGHGPADLTPPARRRFWQRVVGKGGAPADHAGPDDETSEIPVAGPARGGGADAAGAPARGPGGTLAAGATPAASEPEPAGDAPAAPDADTPEADAPNADAPEADAPDADAPQADAPEAPAGDATATPQPAQDAGEGDDPPAGQRNGRSDEHPAPGDPLISRRSRS